ncbi:hypothetical protein HD593_000496 [Nonomuraea rubra]|uniref:Uncharacterized protein n=1 Tax=Nonomuraea rubra TaxID=46180 RepID=A0A7X0TVT7_9ACTN|nr:hypothetical protein [Nonomuraea rubra]
MADQDWHGSHPVPFEDGYQRLAWRAPRGRTRRVRVRDHTCECMSVIYELCQAGGLMFIQRTVRSDGGEERHETAWLACAQAKRLWGLLLDGRVG